jgi:heat shock protein HslJ
MTRASAAARFVAVLSCLAHGAIVAMAQAPALRDSAWVLSSLPGRTLVTGTSMTLRFEGDRVSGADGCNRYTAPYTVSGTSLQISPQAASTQKACLEPIMAQAKAFTSALLQTRSYRMSGGRLDLLGTGGAVLASFAPQPQTLAGSSWTVTGYNNGKQAVVSVLNGTTLTMTFDADVRVNGSAGCNTYSGTYKAEGGSLLFGAAATTRRMCTTPERVMEQEQQFLKALAAVATARLEGDRMELRTASGSLAVSLARNKDR